MLKYTDVSGYYEILQLRFVGEDIFDQRVLMNFPDTIVRPQLITERHWQSGMSSLTGK